MTGTLENAKAALAGALELLGSGTTRTAYLGPDNVVYKVDKWFNGNNMEFDNIQMALNKGLPDGLAIPNTSLHKVGEACVIAMEYIDGVPLGECYYQNIGSYCRCDGPCLTMDEYDVAVSINEDSVAGDNIIQLDGVLYLIDMGWKSS